MRSPRGLIAALTAIAVLGVSGANAQASSVNTGTLHLYLPGEFAGCTATSSQSTPALRAILDLVRPSAFLPNSIGRLIGSRGPITSAELTSLQPQTVVYTIDKRFHWSNGDLFSINDLTNAITSGTASNASWADGFHHIVRFNVGPAKKTLRVVFDNHYSDWPRMFRALEHRQATTNCRPEAVVAQPSLGPYNLLSLSSSIAVLQANEMWPHYEQLYRTVIVEAGSPSTRIGATPFVDLRYAFTTQDLVASSSQGDRSAKIGISNRLATLLFSPRRFLTSQLVVRKYLSAALNRQVLINRFVGEQTFAASPAASNLIGQAQIGYDGGGGLSPVTQMTLPVTSNVPFTATVDCQTCAEALLKLGNGLVRIGENATFNGSLLAVRLAVGRSPASQHLGHLIQQQWKLAGVETYVAAYETDKRAAEALANGSADVALVTPVLGPVGSSAASWFGPRRENQLDAGWRSPAGDAAAFLALSTFNPVDALSHWNLLDEQISTNFWARPLFALPYYLRWSSGVTGVVPSNSMDGLVCQLTLWSPSK
jgi:hypothetical protein